ncbi:MAG TPA: hypothetical protein VH373_18455 [Jatrophihabitantaceae bacterium]|jgi:hypothetical protein
MRRTADLPRVLTTGIAAELGISRSAVRHAIIRDGWQRLAPGVVLTVRGEPSRADWALVGLAAAGPGGALSGWDVVRRVDRRLAPSRPPADEVLVLAREGRCRRIGQAWVRVTARPYATVRTSVLDPELRDVALVRPARAIADAALGYRWLSPVRAMVTGAIQQQVCTPDELLAELASCPRNGSGFLRQALEDVADGARSVAETHVLDYLRQADVPPFELNVPLVDGAGQVIAIADVLWRELRAVLEIDSREFHFDEPAWRATMQRHNRLTRHGLAVTHYPPSAVQPGWTGEVTSWLRARAVELGVTYHGRPCVLPAGPPLLVP